ncbi:MAG TPA: DUF983 domain-containing protein [Pyrinomonadaceae bacterium]
MCPACGESSIVSRPFHIKHHCSNCRSLFKREDGFFVGAILANVVITELVILFVWFIGSIVFGLKYEVVLPALFLTGLIFPLAFYHHSWSYWLGLDYVVESLPRV